MQTRFRLTDAYVGRRYLHSLNQDIEISLIRWQSKPQFCFDRRVFGLTIAQHSDATLTNPVNNKHENTQCHWSLCLTPIDIHLSIYWVAIQKTETERFQSCATMYCSIHSISRVNPPPPTHTHTSEQWAPSRHPHRKAIYIPRISHVHTQRIWQLTHMHLTKIQTLNKWYIPNASFIYFSILYNRITMAMRYCDYAYMTCMSLIQVPPQCIEKHTTMDEISVNNAASYLAAWLLFVCPLPNHSIFTFFFSFPISPSSCPSLITLQRSK